MIKDLIFSIVIPVCNEEEYIEDTLRHVVAIEYPNESYEVIVVDYGSADASYQKALTFASENIKVVKLQQTNVSVNVSDARNYGSTLTRVDTDWVFFLNPDTFPEPPFLRSLANFLNVRAKFGYVFGTVEMRPVRAGWWLDMLYSIVNKAFRGKRAAYGGALIVKRPLLDLVVFNENLVTKGPEMPVELLSVKNNLFFFSTNLLHSSLQHFEKNSWSMLQKIMNMYFSKPVLQNSSGQIVLYKFMG
jgi:glycosyltransferase involved in cell wall biosynthesis